MAGRASTDSTLRLGDLRRGTAAQVSSKLMNVKVPDTVSNGIARVARELGATKTDVVIALFNEGLDAAASALKGWKPKNVKLPPPNRACSIPGCGRAHVAKGYCATHYQAFRHGKLRRKK